MILTLATNNMAETSSNIMTYGMDKHADLYPLEHRLWIEWDYRTRFRYGKQVILVDTVTWLVPTTYII